MPPGFAMAPTVQPRPATTLVPSLVVTPVTRPSMTSTLPFVDSSHPLRRPHVGLTMADTEIRGRVGQQLLTVEHTIGHVPADGPIAIEHTIQLLPHRIPVELDERRTFGHGENRIAADRPCRKCSIPARPPGPSLAT